MTSRPVIALLTDFGVADVYVGVMKGVILSACPDVHLVDLTHEVPPQSVLQAAFLLETAVPWFPAGTIFLTVVDPGVGTARRRIALEARGYRFVGPDNGCLSAALSVDSRGPRKLDARYGTREIALDNAVRGVSIENQVLLRRAVSATFEGRDTFAPAAAYLAAGKPMSDLGRSISSIQAYPAFRAPAPKGKARGLVVHIDSYGNIITDIRGEDLTPRGRIHLNDNEFDLVRTYDDAPDDTPVALIGSSGFLEIAVAGGDAAHRLSAAIGDDVEQL